MKYSFKNVRISSIVTFDLFQEDFNIDKIKTNIETCKTRFFGQKIEPMDSKDFYKYYDPDYKKKTKIIQFCVRFNDIQKLTPVLSNFRWENYLKKVNLIFRLDNAGISTARADFFFKFDNSIYTMKLIDIIADTNHLMDSILFKNYLLDKLLSCFMKEKIEKEDRFNNYLTYPVITSTDNNLSHLTKKEICGISWKNTDYKTFNQKKIDKILDNDISPYTWGNFVITTVATCIFYPNKKESYINDRIRVIEMFLRQNFVLRRIDNDLYELFKDLKTRKDQHSLKRSINKIENNHYQINSNLEFYRNTNVALSDMYVIIIDTFTKVFRQDKHYKFVKEKIETCDTIYHGLLNDRKNELMEQIQWIIIILGVLTLVATILFDNIIKLENNLLLGLSTLLITTFIIISVTKFILSKVYEKLKDVNFIFF